MLNLRNLNESENNLQLGIIIFTPPLDFLYGWFYSYRSIRSAFKVCFLLIGNDGGAMHLGDAMGSKVISIVPEVEYPDSIEPWHNKDLAIRLPIECSPCYSIMHCPQGHQPCMSDI